MPKMTIYYDDMSPRPRNEVDISTYDGRFAVRLRTLRERSGMSVAELAEQTGIPKKTIFNWESGLRTPPVESFPKLAEMFGVKVRTLLPDE